MRFGLQDPASSDLSKYYSVIVKYGLVHNESSLEQPVGFWFPVKETFIKKENADYNGSYKVSLKSVFGLKKLHAPSGAIYRNS